MGDVLCEILKLKSEQKRNFLPTITHFQMALWKNNCLVKDTEETEMKQTELIFNVDMLNWTTQILFESISAARRGEIYEADTLSKEQVIAMATFVPNELISTITCGNHYSCFVGALMFVDISGFTSLCEKYAALGPVGAFRLTATLNAYLGSIVDLIFYCGGDLLKFAGDSFIAVWRLSFDEYMKSKVQEVIECAIRIQNALGSFVSDVGVILKVKISISAGNFIFCLMGNDLSSTYILYGMPILEAKQGESYCSSGDVVISPSAFNCIEDSKYLFKKITKGFLKVKHILDENTLKRDAYFDYKVFRRKGYFHSSDTVKNLIQSTMKSRIDIEELKDRPILENEDLVKIGNVLKPFITPPVLSQIKLNSTFHAITEMRHVTIMFVRFKPSCRLESEILNAASIAYNTISNFVKNSYGLVNKMVMYDKDVMLLAIFGMKGYKQKAETRRCLNCASKIRHALKNHHLMTDLSVGVTVGAPFCGVVGHVTRKEFTVIGRPVNRAARLMCRFRDMISCDLDVVKHSKFPMHNFKKLESVHLKGLGRVKDIFQYLELSDPYKLPPLLGRKDILHKFVDMLTNSSSASGMLTVGASRSGKTRLLNEMEGTAITIGWQSIWVTLRAPIKMGVCLLYRLIGVVLGKTLEQRTTKLISMFKDSHWYSQLHLLNEILDVNFPKPYSQRKLTYPANSGLTMFTEVLSRIPGKVLLIIDDAHVLDTHSWLVLIETLAIPNIIVVASVPNTWNVEDQYVMDFMSSPLVITIRLEGLHIEDVGPLACQIMHVQAVPKILPKVLHDLSGGNPGWIQTFLLSYLDSGLLRIQTMRISDINKLAYQRIPGKYLARSAVLQEFLRQAHFIPVCKLSPNFNENAMPALFDDVFLAMFDKLCEFDQMLLKKASIIGEKFHRIVLLHLLNQRDDDVICHAYQRLFDMSILTCAKNVTVLRMTLKKIEVLCTCKIPPEYIEEFPKYAYCQFSRFNYPLFRFSLYNIVPSNQRKECHLAVVEKLKTFIGKCEACIVHRRLIDSMWSNDSIDVLFPRIPTELFKDKLRSQSEKISLREKCKHTGIKKLFTFLASKLRRPKTTTYRTLLKKLMQEEVKLESQKGRGDYSIEPFTLHFPKIMECTCYEQSAELYKQLIYHSEEAGMFHLLLKFLIDYAEQTLLVGNLTQTVSILLRAKEAHAKCISGIKKKKKRMASSPLEGAGVKVKKTQMKSALNKICANLAVCHFFMGRIPQTEKLLVQAGMRFNPMYMLCHIILYLPFIRGKLKKKIISMLSLRCELHITASQVNMTKNEDRDAIRNSFLATVYAKRIKDLKLKSAAYCNYLDLAITLSKMKLTKSLEKTAIKRCLKCYKGNEVADITAMGQLFGAVFKSRFLRGNYQIAAGTGLTALKFTDHLKAEEAEMYLIPLVTQCLVRSLALKEISTLLEKLRLDEEKQFFLNVYHLVNLELFLELGIYNIPVEQSYQEMKEAGVLQDISPEYEFARKLAINFGLLYLRQALFERAKKYVVKDFLPIDMVPDNMFRTLKLLETKLLLFVHYINIGKGIIKLNEEIWLKFSIYGKLYKVNFPAGYPKRLKTGRMCKWRGIRANRGKLRSCLASVFQAELITIIISVANYDTGTEKYWDIGTSENINNSIACHRYGYRYLTLKAYYEILLYHYNHLKRLPGLKYLKLACKMARKLGNKLALMRIRKNIEYWFNSATPAMKEENCFRNPAELSSVITNHSNGETFESLVYKTLPVLPLPLSTQSKIAEMKRKVDLYKKYSRKIFKMG